MVDYKNLSLEQLMQEYIRIMAEERVEQLRDIRNLFAALDIDPQKPRWSSLAEMNAALRHKNQSQGTRTVDKPTRIAEIEHELDIIRGRIPTPKGYVIQTQRIKALNKELKELLA